MEQVEVLEPPGLVGLAGYKGYKENLQELGLILIHQPWFLSIQDQENLDITQQVLVQHQQ